MNISVRIKELRTEKELLQKDLGKEIGATNDQIYYWETGKSEPSIEYIIKLAKFFGVTADYLLGLEN